jgi:membrane carboxypeptidase/penicillin-binding protein
VVPSVVLAFVIAGIALAGFGAVAAFAFFANDLPSPEDLARDPLAQTTNVFDRDGTSLLYQFEVERRESPPRTSPSGPTPASTSSASSGRSVTTC